MNIISYNYQKNNKISYTFTKKLKQFIADVF